MGDGDGGWVVVMVGWVVMVGRVAMSSFPYNCKPS